MPCVGKYSLTRCGCLLRPLRLRRLQPQAVGLGELRGRHELRELAGVDAVRVGHDVARCRLPEDLGETHHRNLLRGDQVAQHHARPHARQLVDVTHNQHLCVFGDGFEERVRQEEVEHGGLINDDGLRLQRVALVVAELHGLGIKGQQAVDGFGLPPGHFGEPLRRPSRRCCQQQRFAHRVPQGDHRFRRVRLAAARSAGEDQHARGSCQFHRLALLLGKRDAPLLRVPINPAPHAREVDLDRRS